MEKEILEKYQSEFEKKAEEEFAKYQESGMARYEKSYEKYKDLEDICKLALYNSDAITQDKERTRRNIDSYLERLEDKNYSFEEVKKIISDIKYI